MGKKIAIAIVLEATLGGIRKHVIDLLKSLPKADFDVIFIYSVKRADDCFKTNLGELREAGVRCFELPMSTRLYSPSNVRCIYKIAAILRKNRVEVVHLHGAVAGALGRMGAFLCGDIKKIIYSPHGGVLNKTESSHLASLYITLEKLLITNKVYLIAVSRDEKEKIHKLFNLSLSRILMIPNGVDISQYCKRKYSLAEVGAEKARLGLQEADFTLLYPALFLEAKGHINFFSTILNDNTLLSPKVKILLAGDGPLRSSVEKLIANTPLEKQVIFLGFVTNIELYYQLSDAVVLPSLNEAFGYVLLEAMAFEKMIFASAVGGIMDIVEHDVNGLLYPPSHLSEMVSDINDYCAGRKDKSRLEKNSLRLLAEKFDLERSVGRIKDLYAS